MKDRINLKTLIVEAFADVIWLYAALIAAPFQVAADYVRHGRPRSSDHDTSAKTAR